MAAITTCQCLIGGEWSAARTERFGEIWNPSTGELIARVPMCDQHVGQAESSRPAEGGRGPIQGRWAKIALDFVVH